MIKKKSRNELRQKRHKRIRQHLIGTSERPRLSVYRSNKAIYCQIIDDIKGHTLVAASSRDLNLTSNNKEDAAKVGKLIAEKALDKGIKQVVFDRSGYLYHGRIASLADAAREAGLEL